MRIRQLLHRDDAPGEEPVFEEPKERCLSCGANLEGNRTYQRFRVCQECGFHFHLSARERIALLVDPGTFHEHDRGVTSIDPLSFHLTERQSYRSKVIDAQRRTDLAEAAYTGTGRIFGREVEFCVIEFSFLGGSIGIVAGERIARSFERAAAKRLPVITVTSTSGTRMQEGLLALMQLPRISVAMNKHAAAGLPHIAIVTDPTTGSAYSSFVSIADIILAEPNALLGYSALRVLQQAESETLPPTAHTAESHFQHGLVDMVVTRPELREKLGALLDILLRDYELSVARPPKAVQQEHTAHGAWEQVQLSRHQQRPTGRDLIRLMTGTFIELRGDRSGEDDPTVMAGFGTLGGEGVVLIAQVRHHSDGRQPGWVRASGFGKATRALKLAEKFSLPVVTLVDTAGAHPGLAEEESGLGNQLAKCLSTMLAVPTPTIAVITGEGSSEAAVALAVADRVLMLDNAVYEVMRPEDAAAIFFQGAERAGEVAERLTLTSHDCVRLGIADATVAEPGEGAHTNPAETAQFIARAVVRQLVVLQRQKPKQRLQRRYERYRSAGSTRSSLRGTLERRIAHLTDRIGRLNDRLRRRRRPFRHASEYTDFPL